MQHRYALRFENGERRGETLPIHEGGMSFGRRPGNAVQILDASVSGRHAEVVLDERGALLRDLGSTNGTRVGAERISERRLAHGDHVLFGNVRLLFIDSEVDAAPPLSEPSAPDAAALAGSAEAAGEGVHTISPEKVARSGARSKIAAGVALVLALAAAGGWWWWQGRDRAGESSARRPVEPVEGNLLAESYSFEEGAPEWEALEAAPAAFVPEPSARRSGANGLRADLAAGEWTLLRSPPARVPRGRSLAVRGFLRAEGSAEGRLGIEFASSTGSAAGVTAWSDTAAEGAGLELLELASEVPPGYDTARAVVLARSTEAPASESAADVERAPAGAVEADDVALVPASAPKPPLALGEYQLTPLGEPPNAAALFKIDRVLLSGFQIVAEEAGPASSALPACGLPLAASLDEAGVRIEVAPAGQGAQRGAPRQLRVRVEPALAGAVASAGEGGYRTHQVEFRREGVASVLAGAGHDLVRLVFDPPAVVNGRPAEGGFELAIALGEGRGALVQLAFQKERDEALNLSRGAREAEASGELGVALARWGRVQDEFPFDPALLEEAEKTRARLVQEGWTEARALALEVERARFFRLVDLFRRCREGARGIAARFQGSEVESAARELELAVEGELAALETELDRSELQRLLSIEASLRERKSEKLAGRVRAYLDERFARELASTGAADGDGPVGDGPVGDGSGGSERR